MFGFPVQAGDEVACGGVRFNVKRVERDCALLLRETADATRQRPAQWYSRMTLKHLAFNPLGKVRPGGLRG
jgi:hypothetical protein